MKIKEFQKSNLMIYQLTGKIMGGEEVLDLCAALKDKLVSGNKNLVIDLEEVEWTNSCGLGMLIGIHVSAVKAGGRLALANVESIRRLLKMTRLDEVLETYDSLEDAIISFEIEKYDKDF